MNITNEKIRALQEFASAHRKLLELWHEETDLNTVPSVDKYPFEKSFDEYDITGWTVQAIAELKERAPKVKYAPQDSYLKSLQNFAAHVESSVNTMLNEMASDNWEYDEKYNILIEVNGESTAIEMHADSYERLSSFVEAEIEEYLVLNSREDK